MRRKDRVIVDMEPVSVRIPKSLLRRMEAFIPHMIADPERTERVRMSLIVRKALAIGLKQLEDKYRKEKL